MKVARIASGPAWAAVVAAVIGALLTVGSTLLTAGKQDETKTELQKLQSDVPALDLSTVEASQIIQLNNQQSERFTGPSVPIEGKIMQALPSGVTIWLVIRLGDAVTTAEVPPKGFVGVYAEGPCAVDLRRKTFDCGDVYLGEAGEKVSYDLFIGLAEPSTARELMKIVNEQNCYRPKQLPNLATDGSSQRICKEMYDHEVPNGMEWLPSLKRSRS